MKQGHTKRGHLCEQSGGRLPGRSTQDEGSGERRARNEIIKEVVASIQKMTVEESFKNEGKGTRWLDLTQSWDCSQIENQMAEQREEEQQLEGIVDRRRIEGSSLKLDAMQKSTGVGGK